MIRGWMDTTTIGELVIVVNDFGLLDLSRLLRRAEIVTLNLDPNPSDIDGSDLSELRIVVDEAELVSIGTDGTAAVFSGGPAALAEFAEELVEWGVCGDIDEPGAHTHFVPEQHSVIAPGSTPLYLAGPMGY